MATLNKQTSTDKRSGSLGSQKNYNEIVELLDALWSYTPSTEKTITTMKALDQALDFPSKKLNAILVSGTNGKGLTIHFSTKLFQEEKIAYGAFYSPHILSYNEHFVINNETISNKTFTELANEVLNAAQTKGISLSSYEILAMMALVYFANNNVDVALFEMREDSPYDATAICHPQVLVVTRITEEDMAPKSDLAASVIKNILKLVKNGTHVISGDQSKLNLQIMAEAVKMNGGTWAMPIRKLAALTYPFEQLHGRCAALAERICQIHIDKFAKNTTILANSLLAKQKGHRGRPTLEAKRESELNPKKTLEQFWKKEVSTLPARFQIIKDKPNILLDNASNVDAFDNLLLGIRLLHYQTPLKGLTFVFGCDAHQMNTRMFLQLLRYFSKKNSAHFIFCPIEEKIPGLNESSWNVEQITNDATSMKIKAKAAKNFEEALETAKKSVDQRDGLVVISGSQSIIVQYWKLKGIKKI